MNTNTHMSMHTNKKKKKQKKALPPKTRIPREKIVEEWTQLHSTIAELTDEDTEAYVSGTLMEDPFYEDTREFVREILMEALSPQCAFDGAVVCDRLFALLDEISKQYK